MPSNTHPRVAIIGAGPAGFFAAEELLRRIPAVSVEVFEKQALPYGLIRYGVAPDHAHTRRIIKLLERTASHPAFKLHTGTEVGRTIGMDALRRQFDAVLVATGAEEPRTTGIPGENLPGVHSSLAFAAWANGHPDYKGTPFDFTAETAVIIGNGNVALDIVRLLARTADELATSDIAPAALERLRHSKVNAIRVIGRRGPAQSAFGENEIREIGTLPGVNICVDPMVAMPNPVDEAELADPAADRARAVVATLREYASRPATPHARVTLSFDFLRRPIAIKGARRAEEITVEMCRLEGDAGHQRSVPTGALQRVPCALVFMAIGHRARPIPGLPFDAQRGVIPTHEHRVIADGQAIPGVYAVGWVKRGATGLIGHNRRDAAATVKAIIEDLARA